MYIYIYIYLLGKFFKHLLHMQKIEKIKQSNKNKLNYHLNCICCNEQKTNKLNLFNCV